MCFGLESGRMGYVMAFVVTGPHHIDFLTDICYEEKVFCLKRKRGK